MKTLWEHIDYAFSHKKAIGHFNIANLEGLWAVFEAAQEASEEAGEKIPVVIGTSEGERDFLGESEIVFLVKYLRETYQYPIFINADHTYSVERTKQALDNGYDMVIIDRAEASYEENVAATKEIVDYRNQHHPHALVETELGFIGSGSNIKDELPEGVSEETMTKPDEAKAFVEQTGVDLLAPSIGNVHGMVKGGNPRLNADRTREIREVAQVPMVLHGGSGSTDEDFVSVIREGVAMIHISTELRRAFREALEESLKETDSIAPYKYMKSPREAMKEAVKNRIMLFWNANQ